MKALLGKLTDEVGKECVFARPRGIRSVLDDYGILTNKLPKEYPFLQNETIWEEIS